MSRIREKLTYANVMATIAVFLALGFGTAWAGTELAKNSVKSKQIQDGAVEHDDLADDAVTSGKVKDGSLLGADFAADQLPQGATGPAGSPDTPAQVLEKIKQVDGSGSGLDADTLAGAAAASFKDGCPATMTEIGARLCVDKVASGTTTWQVAANACADRSLRLPDFGDLYVMWRKGLLTTALEYWSADIVGTPSEGTSAGYAYAVLGTSGVASARSIIGDSAHSFCVTSPSDG
jgi:hypothetical protein